MSKDVSAARIYVQSRGTYTALAAVMWGHGARQCSDAAHPAITNDRSDAARAAPDLSCYLRFLPPCFWALIALVNE